jgi:hypothetical protein
MDIRRDVKPSFVRHTLEWTPELGKIATSSSNFYVKLWFSYSLFNDAVSIARLHSNEW